MSWDLAVKEVAPHIVRIETPDGWGTGFLAFWNHNSTWCGIATAGHVVQQADEWQKPIRIVHTGSVAPRFLQAADRVIFVDPVTDSAVLVFFKGELQLPEIPITLLPMGEPCGIGVDVGWLGYPNIDRTALCFFSGTVSHHLVSRKAYLIDGVAINGVSGGPVIHRPDSGQVQIVGCVSAYHANRATGEALPGLAIAQDVSHFHGVAASIRSIDEANARKLEFEAAQKERAALEAGAASTSLGPPTDPELREEVPDTGGTGDPNLDQSM